ncbi:MAG TPA: hydroxymethylbilane synthase [Actinomycetota bacterium]|nr:hydroxymethylbilane synthase [Actinomycetota bacterium]
MNARLKIRIGTRRSRLALAQTQEVVDRLAALGLGTEVVPMVTSGDRGAGPEGVPGGVKGLFVNDIVRALQQGEIDAAVHSAKDLPADNPTGVVVGAVPERAAPFDVLVTRNGELSDGAVVGTSSIRRKAQLLRARPELKIADVRGNVDTRLRKLQIGDVDALILAAAGLARLGLRPSAAPFPVEEMVPAPGQGALAVQVREEDEVTLEAVRKLEHPRSRLAFDAERAVVVHVGGDCSVPLGAYAEERDGAIRLLAVVVRPDGSDLVWAQAEASDPQQVGLEVADILLAEGAAEILKEGT